MNGIKLAFLSAFISGFAVFLNKFGVGLWQNPSAYTTAKNIVAALFLLSLFLIFGKFREIKTFSRRTWLQLFLIGFIGGSIPFLLFFKALSVIPASEAAFIHKTLFIWVALFSYPFLKEKLGLTQVGALLILSFSIYFLGAPTKWFLGMGAFLALGATILWAFENIIAKIALREVSSITLGSARMFFGSIFLLAYLFVIGEADDIIPSSAKQAQWAFIVGAVLFAYVASWYAALKRAPATIVASILVIAFPITTILEGIVIKHDFPNQIIVPGLAMIFGILFMVKFLPQSLRTLFRKIPQNPLTAIK